jgi:hypothetical protein
LDKKSDVYSIGVLMWKFQVDDDSNNTLTNALPQDWSLNDV